MTMSISFGGDARDKCPSGSNLCVWVFLGVLKQKAAVTSDLDIHRIAVEQGDAPRDCRKEDGDRFVISSKLISMLGHGSRSKMVRKRAAKL